MPTAQEAYLQNLQYRAVNAPQTITQAEAPYATQYTASLDAYKEAVKYTQAQQQAAEEASRGESAAYRQITEQYAASRNRVVTGGGVTYQGAATPTNPYPENTAAAIAWEVGRTGGAVDIGVAQKALAEGAKPSEVIVATGQYAERGGGLVPIRQNVSVSELLAAPSTSVVSGVSQVQTPSKVPTESRVKGEPTGSTLSELYVPYGKYVQTKLENVKTAVDPLTGELAIYQEARPGQWLLIGGGGRGALQSGRFSTEALTPFVTTQLGAGTYKMPTGGGMSSLGAEAYGGKVMALDSRVLEPGTQISRYAGTSNLANIAAQVALGKTEAPGAAIPWSVPATAPAIQKMGPSGLTGEAVTGVGVGIPTTSRVLAMGPTVTETGSKTSSYGPEVTERIGGTLTPSEQIAKALPEPFISASTQIVKPTGELAFTVPFTETTLRATPPAPISDIVAFFQPETKVTTKPLPATYTPEVTTLKETRYYEVPGVGTTTEKIYEKTGGMSRFTVPTPEEIKGSSGFDVAGQTFLKAIGAPPAAVGEKALEISELYNPLSQQNIGIRAGREIAYTGLGLLGVETKAAKEQATAVAEATSLTKGQYQQFTEQPFLMPASLAVASVFGLAAKGTEAAYMAGRAGIAERVISQGGAWRALEQTGATVVSRAPQVLGGLYALDIGARSVEGASTPTEAVTRARGLVVQEAAPMGVGFASGYKAPVAISTAIGEAKIGLQQAKVELAAQKTSLLQPAEPYKASDITTRELAGYKVDEATAGVKQAARDIVSGRTFELAKIGVQQRVEETRAVARALPSAAESVYARAYKTYFETKLEAPARLQRVFEQAPKYAEATRGYFEYPGIETKAYPKGTTVSKTVSEAVLSARVKAADIGDVIRYKATRAWEYTPKQEIQRYPVSEKVAMAYRYDVIPGETVYGKTFGRILAPSTYGEAPIPKAEIIAARKSHFEDDGVAAKTKPVSPGGSGRVITTTVGGRPRSRLAKEPSLKSMGVKEITTRTTGIQVGRTIDYRGKPVSGTMKPMKESTYGYSGKQAAGQIQIMREPLPTVEGMTTGRMAPQMTAQRPYAVGMLPARMEAADITVTEQVGGRQISIQRQRQEVAPMYQLAQAQTPELARAQRERVAYIQSLTQRTGLAGIQDISTGRAQAREQRVVSARAREVARAEDIARVQERRVGFVQRGAQTTTTIQTTIQIPRVTQITRTDLVTTTETTGIRIVPEEFKIPTGGILPSGGGTFPERKRGGAYRFAERFLYGMGVSTRLYRR